MEELTWKYRKEHFVSGLNGTTFLEITIISSLSPVFVLMRAVMLSFLPFCVIQKSLARYTLDFALLILPVILTVTELSDYSTLILFTSVSAVISYLVLFAKNNIPLRENTVSACYVAPSFYKSLINDDAHKQEDGGSVESKSDKLDERNYERNPVYVSSTKLPFVDSFRAYVNIATCICILAVDFHMYPRRLAKAENFGAGLMDLGVGGYIFSNALVCREARKKRKQDGLSTTFTRVNFTSLLFQIISTWPIIFLGFMRLISIKLSGYQEHVTEYGVHWNFFFTLASVKILASVILFLIDVKYCAVMSSVIAVSYQFILSHSSVNVTDILLNTNRDGFFMQNKEGLASCFGFLSLYFSGVYVGAFIFKQRQTLHQWQKAATKLLTISLVLWSMLHICSSSIQPVSRRLANLAYITWLLAHSTLFLFAFLQVDIIVATFIHKRCLPLKSMPDRWLLSPQNSADVNIKIDHSPPKPTLSLINAICRNQLFYFLLCNLLTGAVNAMFDTLSTDNFLSLMILCIYSLITTSIVWILHVNEVTVKFW